jgi:hypothetical protein
MEYDFNFRFFKGKFSDEYGDLSLFGQLISAVKEKCYLNDEQARNFIVRSIANGIDRDMSIPD